MNMPISRLCHSFYLTNLQIVLPITYHCISKNVYLICCFKTVAVEVVRQLTNIDNTDTDYNCNGESSCLFGKGFEMEDSGIDTNDNEVT